MKHKVANILTGMSIKTNDPNHTDFLLQEENWGGTCIMSDECAKTANPYNYLPHHLTSEVREQF